MQLSELIKKDPVIERVAKAEEVIWFNPGLRCRDAAFEGISLTMADIDQTASLDAGVKRLPAQRITFDSESSRQRVTILALTLIPGVLLLTMAVVLLKRRRL